MTVNFEQARKVHRAIFEDDYSPDNDRHGLLDAEVRRQQPYSDNTIPTSIGKSGKLFRPGTYLFFIRINGEKVNSSYMSF